MTTASVPASVVAVRRLDANAILTGVARFWFVIALIGQWAFFYYIVAFYGAATLQGNFQSWNRNTMLSGGYAHGDTVGNLFFAAHVLLAGIVALGGTVQLIPQLRARFPAVHRWNGRLFLFTAMATSTGGLYLTWVRRTSGLAGQIAISLDALLIFAFGFLAWRAARARDFSQHRRWALRAFIAANGVWFIRIGVMAWVVVQQGPVAMKTFFGYWQFGCYLLPLLVLEIYLRAKDGSAAREKVLVAGALAFLTLLMAAGIVGTYAFSWRPLIAKL